MNAKLLVASGKTTKREVALQLPAVLGRSREADVTVAHPLISRRHCELFEENGVLMLRDLASLNGTMIGGHRVELAPLLPDGEFTIGPLTFRVDYEFDGDLESIPETRYVAESQGSAGSLAAGGTEEVPMLEIDEGASGQSSGDSSSSDGFAMPDFLALADADVEEIPDAESPAQSTSPAVPAGSKRRPT